MHPRRRRPTRRRRRTERRPHARRCWPQTRRLRTRSLRAASAVPRFRGAGARRCARCRRPRRRRAPGRARPRACSCGRTARRCSRAATACATCARASASTPAASFRLASVTKQLTATAVMLLVHDGKLRYEDALTDVFPAFPAYGRAITIRHLLTHTSGLPDYEDLMAAAEKGRAPIWTPQRQIQRRRGARAPARARRGAASPPARAGPTATRATSSSASSWRASRVSRSASSCRQRSSTGWRWIGRSRTSRANEVPDACLRPHETADAFREADQSATSATLGDGGVYSNLEDLATWDEALRSDALLSPGAMRPALTPATARRRLRAALAGRRRRRRQPRSRAGRSRTASAGSSTPGAAAPRHVAPRRDERLPHGDRALSGRSPDGRDPREPRRPRRPRARPRVADLYLVR